MAFDDTREYRYERRGDEYVLKGWYNGRERTETATVDTTPLWLATVINVARVSGVLTPVRRPPPDEILWFRTDRKRNLICFVEL